ncbi:MAG: hypothetical protein IT518_22260 [Burkholderiales bacterium]|nr:hypothetical protein [Burkholderiales bacterium]
MLGIDTIGLSVGQKAWHCTRFTVTGTWTKNAASGDLAYVRCVGPGGGGGRGTDGSSSGGGAGQGGHGGQCVEGFVDISGTPNATVTIGAVGAGAVASATNGGDGQDVSFGTLMRAQGGKGGARGGGAQNTPTIASSFPLRDVHPSIAGTYSGDANTFGYVHPLDPSARPAVGSSNTYPGGGAGGGARYGPGGAGGNGVATGAGNAGSTPAGYGGGGGGGSAGSTTSGNGAAGAPGVVEVWEFY